MPYYSELGSYSGSSSLYSPSYISGPYANHSSILASNYIRPPSSYINALSRNYRGYKPHLSTISERRTDSPLRRIIPQLVIHSVPKVNIPRPIKINTADIDVSINKYRNFDRPSRNTTNTNKERQTASKSPSPTKTVESPRGSFEIKEATPNKTIKRERATVRLKTIHKDRLPLNELSCRKWRDNFHPNELNPDEVNIELKKPKKTPGELLKEKFLIPHKVDIQEAPVKQRIERRGSVKAKSAVLKSPSFHDICKAITYETIDEELNPGQPVEIQRRQSRQFSTEDILKEVRRNSRELTENDIGMLNSSIDGKSGFGEDKIQEVDHDEEPFDSRGSVKKRRRVSRTYSGDIMLNDPESCKTTIQRRPAQKKYKRTSTDSSFASDSETEKAYQKAIRDISQVEVEEIKTKPKPIITTSVDIEEKKVPKLKAIVDEVEVVESPTYKKTNKLIFNFTFEEIKDNQLETESIIPESTQDKQLVENEIEKKDKPKSNKSPLKPKQKKELKPGFAIENYGVHHVPKSKDMIVSKMIRNKQQAQMGHVLENINETPTEENDGNENCKIGESENVQYKSGCDENSKNKLNVITECDNNKTFLKPLEKSDSKLKLKLEKGSSDTLTKSSEELIKDENLSTEYNKVIPTSTKEKIKLNVTTKPKLPNEIVKVKSSLTAKQEIKVEAIAKALRASLGRKDVIKDIGPKSTIRVLNREKMPTELTDEKREVNEDQSSTVTKPKTSTQVLSSLDSGCSVEGTNNKQLNSGIGEETQAKIAIPITVLDNKTKTTENKKTISESKLISELPNNDIKKTTSTMKTSSIKNKNKSDHKIDLNVNTENFWEQIGTRESVRIFKRPILSSKGSILVPELDKIDKDENTDKVITTKIDIKDEIKETAKLETNKIEVEVERKKLISKRSLIQKANKIDPDMVVFEPPEPEPEEVVVEEKKDVFIPLQSNRISQFMNPFHKPEQFDVCPVEIFARPKTIRKRHYPRGRHHAAQIQPPPPPPQVEEDETSEEESDESSSESEATTEGEFEINDSGKVGASTSSNDSGFDSGAAPGSRDKGSGSHSESRESPASTPATNPAFALDNEEDYSKSSTYASFQKNGRITPPATTIPRFRKYCVEDFNFLKLLGKGSFGKVLLAELKDTEYYYAVKCLKKDVVLEDDDVECTLIERKVLALGTKHPYLCHLLCTFQTDSHLFFVMEYLNGGDLMFHIQQSGRFPEARARFYGAEIVSGLKFLHNKGIVYRDLKLDNILLDFDGHVRIADFGMCKLQVFLDRMADTFCGTPDYMAPEIIKGQHYNQSVDWWSYGVLLYEMLLGQSPFSGCDEDELFWSICNEKPVLPRFLSTDASNILTLFLEKDANNRLGNRFCPSGDITDQPFFRSINWDQLEARLLEPPFKPTLQHPLDTKYFDTTFTVEKAKLTPIEQNILESMDQTQFQGFSYTNPNATDK